jgi:hypothetical protein
MLAASRDCEQEYSSEQLWTVRVAFVCAALPYLRVWEQRHGVSCYTSSTVVLNNTDST